MGGSDSCGLSCIWKKRRRDPYWLERVSMSSRGPLPCARARPDRLGGYWYVFAPSLGGPSEHQRVPYLLCKTVRTRGPRGFGAGWLLVGVAVASSVFCRTHRSMQLCVLSPRPQGGGAVVILPSRSWCGGTRVHANVIKNAKHVSISSRFAQTLARYSSVSLLPASNQSQRTAWVAA